MNEPIIPTDTAAAASTELTDGDWQQAEGAHERYKNLLDAKPAAKARYDAVLAEIAAAKPPSGGSAKPAL